MARKPKGPKQVETLTHAEAKRKNIPTAELQSAAERMEEASPFEPVTYPRAHPLAEGEVRERDEDLDPQIIWKGATLRLSPEQIVELTKTGKLEIGEAQLTWRGKDTQDWSDLVVQAPPLYIQEKVHPKAIIEDLKRQSEKRAKEKTDAPDLFDMFEDFNGIDPEAKTEFYQHDQNWQNRVILGDSLQVMASLAEREGLRGEVQCIYFDPPYGIKFGSNWQVSTRSKDVKDGKLEQITREPEQVKAFRDTWKDGVHSYLTYLRDRLTSMRDLLSESGSIFVQIGDENVHRVRALLDEVFGEQNFVREIAVAKTAGLGSGYLPAAIDFVLWYARDIGSMKYRPIFVDKAADDGSDKVYRKIDEFGDVFRIDNLTSPNQGVQSCLFDAEFLGNKYILPSQSQWKTKFEGMQRLYKASRLEAGKGLYYRRYLKDFPVKGLNNLWQDTGVGGFVEPKYYVVQTNTKIIQRCILMTTDPGDLVLDPTCGSGSSAISAEQWGRRWITIDTSRVSLALARTRLMGARFPYFLLADSSEGRKKEEEVTGRILSREPTYGQIRQGFVYERAPHVMLSSISNNIEIVYGVCVAIISHAHITHGGGCQTAHMRRAVCGSEEEEEEREEEGREKKEEEAASAASLRSAAAITVTWAAPQIRGRTDSVQKQYCSCACGQMHCFPAQ